MDTAHSRRNERLVLKDTSSTRASANKGGLVLCFASLVESRFGSLYDTAMFPCL